MADTFILSAPAVGGSVPLKLYDMGDGTFSFHPRNVVETAGASQDYAGDESSDIVAASATPRSVALTNRGGTGTGEYVKYAVDDDAAGASTERRLFVGERLVLADGRPFKERVSIFAPFPTTIEWETWS